MNPSRQDVIDRGNAIYHASKTIKNGHVADQMEYFINSLRIKFINRDEFDKLINNIKIFKEGIEMTGNKLNSEFRDGIIVFCDMCIEFLEIEKENYL